MSSNKVTSLVTGGAGFMGAHVARELLSMGHQVVVMDDLSGGFKENLPEGVEFVQGSITDPMLLEGMFSDYHFDYVYHLAAYAAEGLSHFIKRFNYTNNLIGSINLINESVKHEVKCFVFTSSIAVYGSLTPPMKESMTPCPEDPYGVAKLAVEQDLKTTAQMFGLDYVIFRPHNVYGELQNLGDKYRNVVGIFMNQLMAGKPLSVFGDGEQTRAFSYVGDIAPLIARVVDNPQARNEIFNVGSDKHYSVKDLAFMTMKAMGIEGELEYLKARKETVHAYSCHQKAKEVLGASDKTSLEQGLYQMAQWAKKAGARKSSSFENIEILRGLPESWARELEQA